MKPQAQLEVRMVPIDDLVMYEGNAKLHPAEQIDQIAESIEEFNFADPVAAWHDKDGNSVIIEGHGRLMAARKLGIKELPVIYLDYLTDEQRRAYTLIHNKLTMNSDFDFEILQNELDSIFNIDMSDFGFSTGIENSDVTSGSEKYSQKITTPIYEVKGEDPEIIELYNDTKYNQLCDEILDSGLPDDIEKFLMLAASRHIEFNYGKIAEFYARQDKKIQELMENSTLVIVDFEKAIELGCVRAGIDLISLREEDISE